MVDKILSRKAKANYLPYSTKLPRDKLSWLGHYASIHGKTFVFASKNDHKCQNALKFVGKHSWFNQKPQNL